VHYVGSNYTNSLHMFLSFSVVSLFIDLQINPFRPSPIHSTTESQSFMLIIKSQLVRPLWRDPKTFFRQDPNPLSATLCLGFSWCIWNRPVPYFRRYCANARRNCLCAVMVKANPGKEGTTDDNFLEITLASSVWTRVSSHCLCSVTSLLLS
jgi:hypothetical protein